MKKILAVVLGTLAASSFADVTLYGRISAAVENDQFPQANMQEPALTSIQDYGSYWGIRGTDQVFGQTAVVWQVEQFLNIATGEAYQNNTGSGWVPSNPNGGSLARNQGVATSTQNVLASSDSYIGLQGGWGRVRIGNLSNTFRTNTGAVDIYNGANANGMGTYDRVMAILPTTARFDSPTWGNFSFNAYLSTNTDGNFNTGGANGNGMMAGGDENGYNNAPIYGFGLAWQPGKFGVTLNTQIASDVGMYKTYGGTVGGYGPGTTDSNGNFSGQQVTQGLTAYASRLEFSYNNPDSWFVGVGGQITQGYGYFSVAGNGNMNNLWIQNSAAGNVNGQYLNANTGSSWTSLNTANLGTAEAGLSFGWHVNNWTPKIGYVYGSNMMNGGSPWDLINGNNQIGGTGYQQVVAELDWNITPRTIAFVNWGQVWWGNTATSMVKGTDPGTNNMNQAGGSTWVNNSTTAVGFSHTF